MKFAGQFRVEGELGYRASTLSSLSDINHLTAMANLLYDIPIGERFVVSLGGGVGADRISWTGYGYLPPAFFTTGSFSGADWHFAAQGLASASFKISESTRLDLKYRYMVPTSVDLPLLNAVGSGGNYEFTADDISTHTVSLGLTFDLD